MTARVLVVDDILSNVKLLEAKLTAEYFEVISAFNGQECLAKMEEGAPDIVLLDVMMPGMDGFEVCRRIKSNPKTAHVPVVMVTALDQPSDRVAGLEAGADDFLTKPVDDAALFARVRSLVRLPHSHVQVVGTVVGNNDIMSSIGQPCSPPMHDIIAFQLNAGIHPVNKSFPRVHFLQHFSLLLSVTQLNILPVLRLKLCSVCIARHHDLIAP